MKARTLAEIDQDASVAREIVPRLLDGIRIAELLGISHRQFQRLVQHGKFPKPLPIGHNTPRWPATDYNAYVAKLREQQAKRKRHV
jgi:predicted DNA-binding transcriptional regulator AlpA